MADDVDQPQTHDLLLHRERYGKEQLVVLAAVERRHDGIDVHLFGQSGGLTCNGYAFEIYAGTASRAAADLYQVAGKSVREVDHRGGADALLGQSLRDVDARLRFEILFEQIFVALELRFGVVDVVQHALLAFEQMQSHVGGAHVAAYADQVVLRSSAAVYQPVALGLPQCRDVYYQTVHRGRRVAAGDVDAEPVAGRACTLVKLFERLDRYFGRYAEREQDLRRACIHSYDVADAARYYLVSQMFERKICQVEVDALGQHVGRDDHNAAVAAVYNGSIVACAGKRRGIVRLDAGCKTVDEAEFAERFDACRLFCRHGYQNFYKIRFLLASCKKKVKFAEVFFSTALRYDRK